MKRKNEKMDAGTLEEIQQEYELSIIQHREARRILDEKQKLIENIDSEFRIAKNKLSNAQGFVNDNRKKYEDALYEFWGENNE